MSGTPIPRQCSSCSHWEAIPKHILGCVDDHENTMFGDCRRRPPEVLQVMIKGRLPITPASHDLAPESDIHLVIQEATRWPITARYHSCGEYNEGASA